MPDPEVAFFHSFWRTRIVVLSAFGLVGIGTIFGAGSVYFFYLRRKFKDILHIQTNLDTEIENLKTDVQRLSEVIEKKNSQASAGSKHSNSSLKGGRKNWLGASGGTRMVRFKDGYETADDEEYVTASSESEGDDETLISSVPIADASGIAWIDDFFREVDVQFLGDSSSQHEAYRGLQIQKDKMSHVCGFWWRYAKATHLEAASAGGAGDKDTQKSLTFAASTRAETALSLNDKSAEAHKWYAITLGSCGDYLSVNERIKNGFTFKEHVDIAAKLNPSSDSTIHYLLGRFCYEVSGLSWMERKVAGALFSAPPTATPEEAIVHFKTAERIGKPQLKENRLYMAKCYISMKQNEQAALWLKKCIELPIKAAADRAADEEARKLFPKYQQYLR